MAPASSAYPVREWRPEFSRLESDMQDALRREGEVAVSTPLAEGKRAQLGIALQQLGAAADQVFSLPSGEDESKAQEAARAELEPKRVQISEIVAELLRLNDQAQEEAARRINQVYGGVRTEILALTALFFLLALGTGLYTFGANRRTFHRLQLLAAQLSVQSGQLRRLSWKLIDVQEDTLRQVARDLHDEFGQILTAIGLMLRRVGRLPAAAADPALASELREAKQVVEDTLQRVRGQSQMFRPAVLDDFGLEQTLDWLSQQFERQAGLAVHFYSIHSGQPGELDGELAPEDSIHVYRIVQEALNNAVRHANASQAWVTLDQRPGELRVEVRDDGLGFAVADAESVGLGLMGMRERAEHLQGMLAVQSAPGQGTVIEVRVPRSIKALPQVPEGVT
jgi:signal transduction histidine kinase